MSFCLVWGCGNPIDEQLSWGQDKLGLRVGLWKQAEMCFLICQELLSITKAAFIVMPYLCGKKMLHFLNSARNGWDMSERKKIIVSMNKILLMLSRMCFCVWVGLWSSVAALDVQLCQLEHCEGARLYKRFCLPWCVLVLVISVKGSVFFLCVYVFVCVLVCQGASMWRPRVDIWCLL